MITNKKEIIDNFERIMMISPCGTGSFEENVFKRFITKLQSHLVNDSYVKAIISDLYWGKFFSEDYPYLLEKIKNIFTQSGWKVNYGESFSIPMFNVLDSEHNNTAIICYNNGEIYYDNILAKEVILPCQNSIIKTHQSYNQKYRNSNSFFWIEIHNIKDQNELEN